MNGRDDKHGGARRAARLVYALSVLALVNGCDALRPAVAPYPTFFVLSAPDRSVNAQPPASAQTSRNGPALVISPPRAAAGFDSPHMIYVRRANELEHYAQNEWIDTPARMLAPLLVASLENSLAFRAVARAPSPLVDALRLDTEVVKLQQEFFGAPSIVRFVLRASLFDGNSRLVLATREFEATAPAPTENPAGGVAAANAAVHSVLTQLAAFCADMTKKADSAP